MAAASIEAGKEYTIMTWDHRVRLRRITLLITSLAGGANTIPHGLVQPSNPSAAAVPKEVNWIKTSDITGYETQDADGTNLYYTQTAGAGTTMKAIVTV
jgi:hypothetical protein